MEMVLDDDIIVLTKVDITSTNEPGETDDSDDDSRDELWQIYKDESDLELDYDDEMFDDLLDEEDFIDDRPESELSEHSDNSASRSEDDKEQDLEYDSESEAEDNAGESASESQGQNDDETDNEDGTMESERQNAGESDTENESERKNGNNNEQESDSDDEPIHVSPRKKPRVDLFKEDSSDSSNDDDVRRNNSLSPDSRDSSSGSEVKDSSGSEEDQSSGSEEEEALGSKENNGYCHPNPFGWKKISKTKKVPKNLQHQQPPPQHVNKFGVYLLPKINNKLVKESILILFSQDSKKVIESLFPFFNRLTSLRYHGRIGREGIKGICRQMTKKKFCDLIKRKRVRDGFTRLNILYANARHLECRKSKSRLEKPIRKFLIHLIDQWFPLGIPQSRHLDRAINLLKCLMQKIANRKKPSLKYSNKFYALIPHQGDERRRARFVTVEQCQNKIDYVNKMKLAINCLTEAEDQRDTNPLDYFIENWLSVELDVLSTDDAVFGTFKKVVQNTQHKNTSRRFAVANIFKVKNLDSETNDAFSSNNVQNHRYLFHFSFASNLPCILREGLHSAPSHIHCINRFLGDGIYFWDAVANAGLNYRSLNTVYILVCRVALGNTQQVSQQYLNHGQTLDWQDNANSIYCLGEMFSTSRDAEETINGIKIYCGQLGERMSYDRGYSLYNEYVVRNKQQVSVDYILKLEKD